MDRAGSAYLAYLTPGDVPVLWARRWRPNDALVLARRISPRGQPAVAASATTDLDGDTILAWSHGPNAANYTASLRILRRNGSRGPVRLLGPINGEPLPYRRPDSPPLLAVDDDGNGVAVWESQPDPESGPLIAWARRVRPDGSVGGKVRLHDRASPAAIGVTPSGWARVILYDAEVDPMLVMSGP